LTTPVVVSAESCGAEVSDVPGVPAVLIRINFQIHETAVVLTMEISIISIRFPVPPTSAWAGSVVEPTPVMVAPAVTTFDATGNSYRR
jgi:hypothetical protein